MTTKRHLLPLSIIGILLSTSLAYAGNPALVASIESDTLSLISVPQIDSSVNTTNVYNDGNDSESPIEDDSVSSNASLTPEFNVDENTGTSSVSTQMTTGSEANFELDGDDERANSSISSTTIYLTQGSDVRTGQDLQLFVRGLLHTNENIKNISVQDNGVSVTRVIPAKLFGFITVENDETIHVTSWGDGTEQVTIDRPWWNIFSREPVDQDILLADIEARMKNIPVSSFKVTLDAETKARIISEIEAAFIVNGAFTQ